MGSITNTKQHTYLYILGYLAWSPPDAFGISYRKTLKLITSPFRSIRKYRYRQLDNFYVHPPGCHLSVRNKAEGNMQRSLPYIGVSKGIRDTLRRILLLRKTSKAYYISRKLELFDRIETLSPEMKVSLRPAVATYFNGYDALYDENDCPTLLYLVIQMSFIFLLVSFLVPLLFGSLGRFFFTQTPREALQPTLLSLIPCILFVIPGVFGETLIERWIENKYAEAYIISCLIRILVYEETRPYDWARIKHKRYLLFTIDRLAFHIEDILPRRLRSGDGDTNAWLLFDSINFVFLTHINFSRFTWKCFGSSFITVYRSMALPQIFSRQH